jgi:hypothetical protein
MTTNEILELKLTLASGGDEITIRQFFFELLKTLWIEQECFDGKRPWGNSGWAFDVYVPLIKAGLVKGKLDEDGYISELNDDAAKEFVLQNIIKPLFEL